MTQFTEDLGCFPIQCQVLTLTLALEERQYLRYPPGTIINGVNVGGQFAVDKKSGGSPPPKEALKLDPDSLGGSVVKSLANTLETSKELEAKVVEVTDQISKEIVAAYNIDQSPLKLAGESFIEKLEDAAVKYQEIEKQIIDAAPDDKQELLGNLIKTAIPLAVGISLTVGSEVAVGLFLGQTVGQMLTASTIALGVSIGGDKALDIAKIDNPIVRGGLKLAVGVATGTAVSNVAKRITSVKNIPKVVEKITKTAERFIEQATKNLES